YHDWEASMYISYAKGARTWERHVDIEKDGVPVSKYCSLPHQVDAWFKAYWRARAMSGASHDVKRIPPLREVVYLDETVRGLFAKSNLPQGHVLSEKDVYLAIPLLKGQISSKEFMSGEVLIKSVKKDKPLFIDMIDSPYAYNESLKGYIYMRGISHDGPKKNKASKKTPHEKNTNGESEKIFQRYIQTQA
ncbi:hypothetical protein HYW87_01750, partial [Candidatus Roizmanbacteria bacterium]|nr:hypothetical protein [Candidatus Roizmanbacteria bacterium]